MPRTATKAPSPEILEAALRGLEAQREKLDEQIRQVHAMMGRRVGRPSKQSGRAENGPAATSGKPRKKRTLSAEARKRIAAAQKKRWATFRKNQE